MSQDFPKICPGLTRKVTPMWTEKWKIYHDPICPAEVRGVSRTCPGCGHITSRVCTEVFQVCPEVFQVCPECV